MLRSLSVMVSLLCLLAFGVYNLLTGDFSLLQRGQIRAEAAQLQARLAQVEARNDVLLARIQGLRPESLDEDYLIEHMHRLSLTLPGEFLIYIDD